MTPQAIGIDFGGTTVKIGVVQGAEVLEKAAPIETQNFQGADALIDEIAKVSAQLQASYPQITAIGAGMPGFVDFPTGRVHNLTNVTGWTNILLKEELQNRTNLPTTIDNDANAMAYAEWKVGAGQGLNHIIALTLGTGVGGGLIIDGKLARGANHVGSELGHVSICFQGKVGPYGNRGGLEEYIGNKQIVAYAQELYKKSGQTPSTQECSPKCLAALAEQGDPIALKVWDHVAEKLACALTSAVFLLNPEAIIIGGGVAKAGPILFHPLREKLFAQIGDPFKTHLQILPAHFSNEAGIIGIANLALEQASLS